MGVTLEDRAYFVVHRYEPTVRREIAGTAIADDSGWVAYLRPFASAAASARAYHDTTRGEVFVVEDGEVRLFAVMARDWSGEA